MVYVKQYSIMVENYIETAECSCHTELGNFTLNIIYHIIEKLFHGDLLVQNRLLLFIQKEICAEEKQHLQLNISDIFHVLFSEMLLQSIINTGNLLYVL